MTPDELRTLFLDAVTWAGGTTWPSKLELGLWTLAIVTAALALIMAVAATREGGR